MTVPGKGIEPLSRFRSETIMNASDAWYLVFALYGMMTAWAMIKGLGDE